MARPPPCLHGAPGSAWSFPARGRRAGEAWPPALPLLLCEMRRQSVAGSSAIRPPTEMLCFICVCVSLFVYCTRGMCSSTFVHAGCSSLPRGESLWCPPSKSAHLPIPKASPYPILHYRRHDAITEHVWEIDAFEADGRAREASAHPFLCSIFVRTDFGQ